MKNNENNNNINVNVDSDNIEITKKICFVEGCDCEVTGVGKFCSKHKVTIDSICSCCHNPIKIKPRNYTPGKEYNCRSCSSKNRINEYNKSEKSRDVRRKNMLNYNMSDQGKKNREKGLAAIHSNYTGSAKHMAQIQALGLKYGPRKLNSK